MKLSSLYLETTRPKTLIAALAPISMIGILHSKALEENFFLYLCIFFATVNIQILTNYFNDYYDLLQKQDTAERIGPKRPFQRGDLTENQMKKALMFLSLSFMLLSLPIIKRLGHLGLMTSFTAYLLSIYYTKGNYSLSKLGVSDLFSFFFFGPLATGICGYAITLTLSPTDFIVGGATGALSTTLLVINHLRDESEDRKNNKTTSVVRFGARFGRILIYIFVNFVRVIPLLIFPMNLLNVFAFAIILIISHLFLLNFQKCRTEKEYALFLAQAAKHFLVQTCLYLFMAWNSTIRF